MKHQIKRIFRMSKSVYMKEKARVTAYYRSMTARLHNQSSSLFREWSQCCALESVGMSSCKRAPLNPARSMNLIKSISSCYCCYSCAHTKAALRTTFSCGFQLKVHSSNAEHCTLTHTHTDSDTIPLLLYSCIEATQQIRLLVC